MPKKGNSRNGGRGNAGARGGRKPAGAADNGVPAAAHKPLTDFELDCIQHYLRHGNRTQAVRDAGSKSKEPKRIAWKVFNKPAVQQELERRRVRDMDELSIGPTTVIAGLKDIAETRIDDIFAIDRKTNNWKLRTFDQMPARALTAIKGVKFDADGRIKSIEFHDKLRAYNMLGDYFNMFSGEDGGGADEALIQETLTLEKRLDRNGELIRQRLEISRTVSGHDARDIIDVGPAPIANSADPGDA